MDRFTMMSTFVQVVKKASFTTAARSLSISRALVSRHISDLESNLGVRLLNRTTRSVSLTEPGQSYFDFCVRVLGEISAEEANISGRNQEAEGTLSIIVPKWIGTQEIADAVTSFSLEYPKINVSLTLGGMSQRTYDFIERGFDIALQTKDIPDSMVKVKKVASIRYVVVASPGFIAGHEPVTDPRAFEKLPCAVQMADPSWRFFQDGAPLAVKVHAAFSSNAYLVLRKAALKGVGVAMVPHSIVAQDLKQGSLIELLPELLLPERPLYAVFAPGDSPPKKVRCFITFLTNWFRPYPTPQINGLLPGAVAASGRVSQSPSPLSTHK